MRAHIPQERHLEILKKENPDIGALLAVYPEEEAAKLLQNKEKLNRIVKAFGQVSVARSQASMVMTCNADCPYKDICILKREAIAPYGHPCPVEKKIVYQLESDVMESLDIEANNPIEMELLWDLIDMKLLDMRASATLKDGKLLQTVESKVGQNTMSKDELSPLIEAKLDLKKLKHSVIDAFVATRRAKKKYGTNNDANSLEQMILRAADDLKEDN
jgi:hypothetical protein